MKQSTLLLQLVFTLLFLCLSSTIKAQCPEITEIGMFNQCKDGYVAVIIYVSDPEGVEYSIDQGMTYQSSNFFKIYEANDFLVFIRKGNACQDVFSFQTSTLPSIRQEVKPTVEYNCNSEVILSAGNGTRYSWFINGEPIPGEHSPYLTLDINDEEGVYYGTYSEPDKCSYTEDFIFDKSQLGYYLDSASIEMSCDMVSDFGTYTSSVGSATTGASDGAIVINMAEGGPYVFSINDGEDFSSCNNFNQLAAGTYEVVVSDGNGCMTIVVEVPAYQEPIESYLNVSGNACRRLILEVNYPEAYNFQWYHNGIALEKETVELISINSLRADEGDVFYASFSSPAGDLTTARYVVEIAEYFTDLGTEYICEGDVFNFSGLTLDTDGLYQFKTTASDGCDSTISINLIVVPESECGESFISGSLFYDNNRNGIQDDNERGIRELPIDITSHDVTLMAAGTGRFFHYAEDGVSYELSVDLSKEPQDKWELTTEFSEISFVFEGGNPKYQNINIGLVHKEDFHAGELYLSPIGFRCNQEEEVVLRFRNLGSDLTENDMVRLDFELDPKYTFLEAVPMPDSQGNNIYSFEISDLKAYRNHSIDLKLQSPDETNTGEAFLIIATATLIKNGEEIVLDEYSIEDVVRCSYDPNDKQVSPIGVDDAHYTLLDENLTYTIRFQNTGNDVAYDVRITDVIDENLDLSTFKIVASSHEMTTSLENNEVEFFFRNILLPDSTSNEPLSHGYVIYEISPIEGISDNTLITNTAEIYFDQNPAIITNTTENLMVESLPTSNVFDERLVEAASIVVFPNPISADQLLTIESRLGIELNLTISDKLGRSILNEVVTESKKTVSISHLQPGLYLCKLQGDGFSKTIKLIIS